MFDDADDLPFGPAAGSVTVHPGHDPVIVHGAMKLPGRNEHVGFISLVIRNQEAEAFAAELETPCHQTHLFWQAVSVKASLYNVAVLFQIQNGVPELMHGFILHGNGENHFLRRHGGVGLPLHERHDFIF